MDEKNNMDEYITEYKKQNPKALIKRGGKYTKKFLKWIEQGEAQATESKQEAKTEAKPLSVSITTNTETQPLIIEQTGETFTGKTIKTKPKTDPPKFKTFRLINGSKNPSKEWKGAKATYTHQEQKKGNNYGIPCGKQNDILCVDIDTYKHADQFKAEFKSVVELVKRCNTYTTETPRGGIHLYFKYVEGYKNKAYGDFIDIKTQGGYIVGAGARVKYEKPFYKYRDQTTGDISELSKITEGFYKCINIAEPVDMPPFMCDYLQSVDIVKHDKSTKTAISNAKRDDTPSLYEYEISDRKLRHILDNYQPPEKQTKPKPKVKMTDTAERKLTKFIKNHLQTIREREATKPTTKYKPVEITEATERILKKFIKNHLQKIEERKPPLIYTILKDRQKWLNFTYCMKALNKPDIWHEYSKKAYDYNEWNDKIEQENQKIYNASHGTKYTDTAFNSFFKKEDVKKMKLRPIPENIIKPTETINRRYIQDMDKPSIYNISEKCIFIKSDTGTGKTASFNHFIKETANNFISLTLRQTLAETQYNDMSETGLMVKHYEIQPQFNNGDNIICQLDSITKININKIDIKNYVLFLDEADALLSYMCTSSTLKKILYPVFKFLCLILQQCKKIICTDKSLSDTVINFIKHVTGETEYKFIKNDFKNWDGVEAKIWHTEKDIMNDMKQHKNFITATDERRQQVVLNDTLQDNDINYISKTTKAGLNLEAKKICFTPKITEGVDIQPFEKCPTYGIYKTTTINSRTMYQQLTRNRRPTRLNLCFLNNRCNYNDETDENIIYDEYEEGHDTTYNIFDVIATPEEARLYYSMRSHYEMIDRAYKTNPKKHLLKMLKESGFIIKNDHEIKTSEIMSNKEKARLNIETMRDAINGEYDLLQTEEYERINKLLKLPQDVAYENPKLYTSQTALNQHFNIIKFMTNEAQQIKADIDNRQTFKLLKIRCGDNNIRGLKDIINRCDVVESLDNMKELTKDDYEYINDIKKSIKTRGNDKGYISTPEQTRAYICSIYRALFGEDCLKNTGVKRERKQKDKQQTKNKTTKLYDYDKAFFMLHEKISSYRKQPIKNVSLFIEDDE